MKCGKKACLRMNNICGIYQIRNLNNNHIYVGQSYDIPHRFAQHKYMLRKKCHFSKHLQFAWNKYGENSFVFEVLDVCNTYELDEREQNIIDKYKPEYNSKILVAKSNLGFHLSEESKLKISKSKTNPNIETRRNLSESHKGKKQSQETIRKRFKNRTGIKYSDEYKNEKYKTRRNKIVSEETRLKLSMAAKAAWDRKKMCGDLQLANEMWLRGEFK